MEITESEGLDAIVTSEFRRIYAIGKENPELRYFTNIVAEFLISLIIGDAIVNDTAKTFGDLSDDHLMRGILRAHHTDFQFRTMNKLDKIVEFTNSPLNPQNFHRIRENRLSVILIFAKIRGADEKHLKQIIQTWVWMKFSGMHLIGKEMPHDKYLSDDHELLKKRMEDAAARQEGMKKKTEPQAN